MLSFLACWVVPRYSVVRKSAGLCWLPAQRRKVCWLLCAAVDPDMFMHSPVLPPRHVHLLARRRPRNTFTLMSKVSVPLKAPSYCLLLLCVGLSFHLVAFHAASPSLGSSSWKLSLVKLVVHNTKVGSPWLWSLFLLLGIPGCMARTLGDSLGSAFTTWAGSLWDQAVSSMASRNRAGDPDQEEGRNHSGLNLVLLKVSWNCPLRLVLLKE